MQLNAQDIASYCDPDHYLTRRFRWHGGDGPTPVQMITPFSYERTIIRGRSAGLSAATYDVRIAADLILGVNPGFTLARALREMDLEAQPAHNLALLQDAAIDSLREPPHALANTMENFAMPLGVCGYVVDKSSHARLFVTAFNTFLDPGWRGNLTLELVNLSDKRVVLYAGDPICQIAFHYLTVDTDRPYKGKYQDQPKRPVEAILELEYKP